MQGYDLNIVVRVMKTVASSTGSLLKRSVSGTTYTTKALIWKAHTNSRRKCSNISVKKYQNKPMFGFKSGTVNLETKM